jgi:putative redox protein
VLGNIPVDKLKRAAELTFQEYCSVSKMLEKSAQITYELYLNNQKI